MAQVPASSRGFSGGTLTSPLVIDRTGQATGTPLTVDANDPNNALTYSADGRLTVGVGDSTAGIAVLGNTDSRQLYLFEGLAPLYAQNAAGAEVIYARADTYTELRPIVIGNAAPADGALAAGQCALWFDQTNGAAKLGLRARQADGTALAPGLSGRDLSTAPAASSASTLALGAAYQNTLGYDVLLTVYLSVTVNTSGVLKLGVGPTNTPTQQTLVTGLTATGLWPVPIYLPASYYALLSVSGTITVAVDGQIAMPV